MEKTIRPSTARKNLFQLLKDVNQTNTAVHIIGQNEENNAFLVGESDWNSIQETLYLYQSGEAQRIMADEQHSPSKDNVDVTGGINWDIV